jgi:eukaryotic-like serine/threonine-protein kinase
MTLELKEGEDFSSRYSLLHQISAHDSIEVWLALDKENVERVCLKILEGEAEKYENTTAAISASRGLVHPNITRNYECGVIDGNLFIASNYVKSSQPLNLKNASFNAIWSVLTQLFDALEFAHSLNIMHGRLHPGNLLVNEQNQLFITGFSLPTNLSQQNTGYLSVEVQQGQAADTSDDIYSLGCILFLLLTKRTWHQGETFETNSPIPDEVQSIVAAMLDPSPYKRLADLTEAKDILANYAEGVVGAKSIEIEHASFSRADSAPIPEPKSTPTHQLPRERHQVSMTLVLGGLVALLFIAGIVFFILPGTNDASHIAHQEEGTTPTNSTVRSPDKPEQKSEEPKPEKEQLAPFEVAQLAFLKDEGKRIASELLRAQVELEDSGVLLWAPESYANVSKLAESGDQFYRDENFQEAIDAYEAAITLLDELKEMIPAMLESNLATGKAAINNGDSTTALISWSIAHAIRPLDAEINNQLLRAENLEDVLTHMKMAEFHERESALKEALKAYLAAVRLDPAWTPADDGASRIRSEIARRAFTDAMSVGFTQLATKEYKAARLAFNRAQKIFPNSDEPADGILQIDLAERMDVIEDHQQEASDLVDSEDWPKAIEEFKAVLALDQTLVFAKEGLKLAEERLELDNTLNRFLQQPTIMHNDDEFAAAKRALVSASRAKPTGPRIKNQLSTLSRLISVARIPITVQLNSDNKTDVIMYKVGSFGKMENKALQLIPGEYTIIGTRRGYRDVRQKLVLLAGISIAPINVRCVEKI